jgi:hypothetical protein
MAKNTDKSNPFLNYDPSTKPYVRDRANDVRRRPVIDANSIQMFSADKPKPTIAKRRSTDPVNWESL